MRNVFVVLCALMIVTSPGAAQEWSPEPMVIDVEDRVDLWVWDDPVEFEIPFSLSGKAGKLWLVIESNLDESQLPEAVMNGFKGWHYINKIDTTKYVSVPREYEIGSDHVFPVAVQEPHSGIQHVGKQAPDNDTVFSPVLQRYYRYYIWGYDHQSDREIAIDFLPIGNYWEGQYQRFYVNDDQGAPYDAPMLMGQVPFFYAESASARTNNRIGRADLFKWRLGNDPYNSDMLETSAIYGYGPNETIIHPGYSEETPEYQYSLGYGAGIFDPLDHDVFYFAQNRHWENTQTVVKYDYVANGEAIRDYDWGGYENDLHWDHPGNNGDYSKKSVIHSLNDDYLVMLDPGENPMDYQHDRLHVLSKEDPFVELFDITLDEFYMPNQQVDPSTQDTRTSSEINRLVPGRTDGTFYITGAYSCLTELIDMNRLMDEETLDPYQEDGDGYVIWANSNGDYFLDMSPVQDPSFPEQHWACIVSDPRNNNNPRRYLSTPDMNGFMVAYTEFTGVNSFGIYAPDGTGMGYAGFHDTINYGGDLPYERGGGEVLDYGGQFDGMYLPPAKFGGSYDDPDMLKTAWIACDSDMGYLYVDWHDEFLEFIPPEDEGDTSGIEEHPRSFMVAQNAPNPFNPSTTIAFTLPEAGEVTVDVRNVAGQKIATLMDGYHDAGDHSVVWNADGFAAGIYFYTVSYGTHIETRKMTLMK